VPLGSSVQQEFPVVGHAPFAVHGCAHCLVIPSSAQMAPGSQHTLLQAVCPAGHWLPLSPPELPPELPELPPDEEPLSEPASGPPPLGDELDEQAGATMPMTATTATYVLGLILTTEPSSKALACSRTHTP
jgi:hypothetical protein